jgi:hypothetical protein
VHTQMNKELAAKYRRKYGREPPMADTDEFWDFVIDELLERSVRRRLTVEQYIENHVINDDSETRKLVNRVFWRVQFTKSLRRRVSCWH